MFSIVVPVYNKRDTLSNTIASVRAQTFADFELIIVDDGSTDGSLSALKALEERRLRMVIQRNQGPGAARNAGAEAARYDWIAFLDADDLWDDCHLAELDRVRTAHPEAGLIGSSYRRSYSRDSTPCQRPEAWIGLVDYFGAVADGEAVLCASTAAVRRDVWKKSGGFGCFPYGQDSELWVRIASGWPVAISRRPTATYVGGTGGISDRRWRRSFGRPPRNLEDLSPAVMRVLQLRREAPAERRKSYDRFVDRYLQWRLDSAFQHGDVATVRGLRHLYERPPSFVDRCILFVGLLPYPVARGLYRAGKKARIGRILRSGRSLVLNATTRLSRPAHRRLQNAKD